MTLMQEQAMDLIKKMSDEKIYYLIHLLEDFVEPSTLYSTEPTASQRAYQNLQKFRHRGTLERDYKAELCTALDSRMDSIRILHGTPLPDKEE